MTYESSIHRGCGRKILNLQLEALSMSLSFFFFVISNSRKLLLTKEITHDFHFHYY